MSYKFNGEKKGLNVYINYGKPSTSLVCFTFWRMCQFSICYYIYACSLPIPYM